MWTATRHAATWREMPTFLAIWPNNYFNFYPGIMKVPPTADDQIISNAVENNTAESDDGLNEAPHSPSREGDFSEYLWMENEEEFEQQIMQQLEEEALMQQCIEAMQDEMNPFSSSTPSTIYLNGNSNHTSDDILTRGIQNLSVDENTTGQVWNKLKLSLESWFIHWFIHLLLLEQAQSWCGWICTKDKCNF